MKNEWNAMNKKRAKYTIIIVVIVLMSCGVISYNRLENDRLEYNRAAEEFENAYEKMFESMQKAWEDPENSLKERF